LNPEIAFEEHQAHNNICNLFEGPGFEDYQVTRHAYGMDTSFKVEFGSGGRLVIFNAEYDAIPGLKHACGHNLIATGSIAAFIMTCEYLRKSASKETYRVQLLGTPAEEDGGGKIVLLNAGAYEGVDACLMAHPVPVIDQAPEIDGGAAPGGYMARAHVQVTFSGKPAQAAARAWDGINALDAAVAAYLNVSLLRQQLPPDQRINGIILNGGQRANVVPELTSMEYYMRAPSMGSLKKLQTAAIGCFEAACKSTGCRVDFKW
jgi:amidohydrolase